MDTFKYDPFGRRIYKSSSAATSVYAYDGDNLIEETNSSGTAVARYEDTQNVDEPLAMLRSSTTSYYDADGLGSITSLSSSAGSLAQTYGYDSFGKQTSSSGSLTNPFQYTARESDPETGLYYYRARYYDPNAGRFLSEDRVRFRAGPNFYGYAQNNPLLFRDPSGNQRTTGGQTPDICIQVTWSGSMQVPCVDPGGGMTCINNDSYCRIPVTPGPPSPRHVDRSLEILDKVEQCLSEEIEEDLKIQTDLENSIGIWGAKTGGKALGMQGVEAGLEYLGWGAAEFVPFLDFGVLALDLVDGLMINHEATQKLNDAKQRACSCEQRALNK
jgi:RHS repeat-associated protein